MVILEVVFFSKELAGSASLGMVHDGVAVMGGAHKTKAVHEVFVHHPLDDAAEPDGKQKGYYEYHLPLQADQAKGLLNSGWRR